MARPRSVPLPSLPRHGFTLVELLVVVALLALLAGILLPVGLSVRRSALATMTQARFAQYATALEGFRQDYGYYPEFGGTLGGKSDPFYRILSGDPTENTHNPRNIRYYSFAEEEFAADGQLVDAFGNRNLRIAVDRDLDGTIPAGEFTGIPVEQDLHLPVALYSVPGPDNRPPEIRSWR
jgi:prepilin-type N-terminal cleavage/methylation domain-containing protein